ncbi:hypothetical protein [Nostoc sp.]
MGFCTDKNVRPQLNIRLDKHPGLLDEIKAYASERTIKSVIYSPDF